VLRKDADALYAQGVDAVWAVIRRLEERIDELERKSDRDSGNSSMPPSSDPPKSRAERRRLAREAYKRSMRKSGGQPGHQGKTRELVAPERVDEHVAHLPDCCECGHEFDGSEARVGDPVCHQQYELPPVRPGARLCYRFAGLPSRRHQFRPVFALGPCSQLPCLRRSN
jgi:transposase